MVLGLIPDCDLDHVRSAGNAAGTGALIALLSGAARPEIEGVVRTVEKIETAIEPRFQEHFVEAPWRSPTGRPRFAISPGSSTCRRAPRRATAGADPRARPQRRRRPAVAGAGRDER